MKDTSKTKEVKLEIINNFITWYTSDEREREQMSASAFQYVDGDHVDEVAEFIKHDVTETIKEYAKTQQKKILSL